MRLLHVLTPYRSVRRFQGVCLTCLLFYSIHLRGLLEIYAQNGKESKRVADALERLIEHSKERDAKVDEMYEFFYGGHVVTRVAKVAGTFIMACGGAYLMFKSILK